jgi:uncharacterized protein YegJ (DUF2314 family)
MNTLISIVAVVVLVRIAWWWFIGRNRPTMPPLAIDNNDPLMVEARRQASESIPQMLALFNGEEGFTRVKIPFVSSSGETEHLWSELLRVEGSSMHVRYLTPPVSHTGKLERLHTHPVSDVEDWVYTKDPKKYVGGFSMRVMFRRGREQWGDLPPELKAEEAKYV